MLYDMQNELTEYTKQQDEIEQRKAEEVKQTELEDIHFDIALNKEMFKYNYVVIPILILYCTKMMTKATYLGTFDDMPLLLIVSKIILGGCMIYSILYCIFYPTIVERFLCISVKNREFRYRGKIYEANQISMIKVSSQQNIALYVGKKKIVNISKQFLNRDSLLAWARKCNITVYHEPPFDLSFGKIFIIGILVFLCIMGSVLWPYISKMM